MKKWILIVLLTGWLLQLCACAVPAPQPLSEPAIPVPVETVAVWISYPEVEALLGVGDANAVRVAIAACLDTCVSRGINTVYWHVRANSDAYYASSVYPVNAAAQPLLDAGLDPLACAVEAAHSRGISLHAWVNPYRIGTDKNRAKAPDFFEADTRFYYVPTADATRALVVAGVRELVRNYAIDGVQFDDYFYPTGVVSTDQPAAFEQTAYASYTAQGGTQPIGDWRRAAVSRLMAAVYGVCHSRDGCVFGVSPAYNRATNRDSLYADTDRWLRESGYVDYLCPQLYLGFQNESAPFETVLAEWDSCPRSGSVELFAGLALYKTGMAEDSYAGSGAAEWAGGGDIIARQLAAVRAIGWSGVALYSNRSFEAGDGRDAAVVQAEMAALLAALTT